MWVNLSVSQHLRKKSNEAEQGERRLGEHWLSRKRRKATEEKMDKTQIRGWGWPRLPFAITQLFQAYSSPPPSLTPEADGISQRRNMD